MLNDAAKDLKNIQQYLREAKALVQKYRREQEKQEWQSLNDQDVLQAKGTCEHWPAVTEHWQVLHMWHAELMSKELCTP